MTYIYILLGIRVIWAMLEVSGFNAILANDIEYKKLKKRWLHNTSLIYCFRTRFQPNNVPKIIHPLKCNVNCYQFLEDWCGQCNCGYRKHVDGDRKWLLAQKLISHSPSKCSINRYALVAHSFLCVFLVDR